MSSPSTAPTAHPALPSASAVPASSATPSAPADSAESGSAASDAPAAPDTLPSAPTAQPPAIASSQDPRLWGGRFTEATDAFVATFTASVGFDQRLYAQDIAGSIAHARMLARVGVLSTEDAEAITQGLLDIRSEIAAGRFPWSVAREDVHMNIEARLIERLGEVGKRLHTGRSRNDQVATDIRLWLREAIDTLIQQIRDYQHGLLDLAEREQATIMPGFTHLQTAQPITFGHHMLAWYEMLARDVERLQDCRKRVNRLPLGAAALAGTVYPLDRAYTAELLGFAGLCQNSLDAVSDRDFAIEFAAAAAMIMMHLSRQAEELILWTSAPFGFIELPDRYCTGSSIMPQKKNPDVPELVRGKTGRVYGHLMALLTLMKGQPLAYNKDNQEDKEPLFDTFDTLSGSLRAFADMVPQLRVQAARMHAATRQGYATATDLADYLVRKGAAFRDAHETVGRVVRLATERGVDLAELSLADLQAFDARIMADIHGVLTPEGSVAARDLLGGTAPQQVQARIAEARASLAATQEDRSHAPQGG
jgi:argininosuccinate lyase